MTSYYGYPYIALTGGGDGALDSLDGDLLKNGDFAVVVVPGTNKAYIYTLDEDSAAAESSPDVIAPDSNAGDKRWVLVPSAGDLTLTSFLQSGTGAAPRTAQAKIRDIVSARDFGAVGDDSNDDTSAIQAALDTGKHVILDGNGTFQITDLDLSTNGTTLEIQSGSTLKSTVYTNKAVTISGDNCSLCGGGVIESPETWVGTNARRTYSVVWVTGDGANIEGITLNNVPWAGILFEDATSGRVSNVRIKGNYPYASYNEATTTGHAGICYNPPSAASDTSPALVITGCIIETCIQGILVGNFDDTALESGITITGNHFQNCWDHGIYMTLGEGHTIVGNNFFSVRKPIVTDGTSAVVVGNSLYSPGTDQTNHEQMISVREANYSVIANNTISGLNASILCDAVSGTDVIGNIIAGNVLYSTGDGDATAAIRLGSNAEVCRDNKIIGNTIYGGHYDADTGAIQLEIKAGYYGYDNLVQSNHVERTNSGPGIVVNRHSYTSVLDNLFKFSATENNTTAFNLAFATAASAVIIERNQFIYRDGGDNVDVTGVSLSNNASLCRIRNNRFILSANNLNSVSYYNLASTAEVEANQIDPNAFMSGNFSIVTNNNNVNVPNVNVTASSTILLMPTNVGAGAIMKSQGYYVACGNQSFTFYIADGSNAAATANFNYRII